MNINAAVNKIRDDRQHGASQLTRQALELIEQIALHDGSDNMETFQALMSSLLMNWRFAALLWFLSPMRLINTGILLNSLKTPCTKYDKRETKRAIISSLQQMSKMERREAIKQLKYIEDLNIRQFVRITGLTYYEVYKA